MMSVCLYFFRSFCFLCSFFIFLSFKSKAWCSALIWSYFSSTKVIVRCLWDVWGKPESALLERRSGCGWGGVGVGVGGRETRGQGTGRITGETDRGCSWQSQQQVPESSLTQFVMQGSSGVGSETQRHTHTHADVHTEMSRETDDWGEWVDRWGGVGCVGGGRGNVY